MLNDQILNEMKTSFVAGIFTVALLLLSLWEEILLIPTIIFFVFWVIELYNNRPGKASRHKSEQVLKDFLDNIGDVSKLNFVERELNKYSIRQLCYLYDGLDREIYNLQGSDFLMSLREEELQDQMRREYEQVRDLVRERIPQKYRK